MLKAIETIIDQKKVKKLIMEWYVPMTILPGIGLIILSTSNFLIALNIEIAQLC